jgi:hypothetical protein
MERALVKVQRFAVIGNPVMLRGDTGEIGTGAHNLDADRSLQIAGCNTHSGGAAIDLAEAAHIGQDCAAKV